MVSVTPKRFTIQEYYQLTENGFLHEDDRVELIHGEIIQMAAKGTPHTTCCSNLINELAILVAGKATLRCQDPIIIPPNSEPEPDFALVRQREDNYLSGHPKPEDILLVIEIADSTLSYDRGVKVPLYAEAKISHYWIFNLAEDRLETYSEPYQDLQGKFDYALRRVFLPNMTVNLPNLSDLVLNLSKVFPA